MTPRQRLLDGYQRANQECAVIILADTEKYGGDDSLMVKWAHSILEGERPRLRLGLVA